MAKTKVKQKFGNIGQAHHHPTLDMLGQPLARGGGIPTGINAILALDYRRAVAGDANALGRLLQHFYAHELGKMRRQNRKPEFLWQRENLDFEAIDEALALLGIVVEREFRWKESVFDYEESDEGIRVIRDRERTGPGIPDWLLKIARKRRGCPKIVGRHVKDWFAEGALGIRRGSWDDIDEWEYAEDDDE